MGKAINRYGKKYGLLKIGRYIGSRIYAGKMRRYCVATCKCGNIIECPIDQIVKGSVASCGCMRWRVGPANPKWTGYGEISGNYWDHIKRGAKCRGFSVDITIKDVWNQFLIQNRKCAISGTNLIFGKGKIKTASLDRIDSKIGYVEGNIQWVHKDVNKMKQHFDEFYFIKFCERITEYQKAKV